MIKTIPLLFTDTYVKRIQKAIEFNNVETGKIYYHPTPTTIIEKTIDISSKNPLCGVNSVPKGKQNWGERWVEAYLINKAKNNGWKLDLAGKKCRFLASQFTFRRHPEWKGTKHVDLLLYDEKNRNLVVLELKADSESFPTALRELRTYIEELKRLFIEDEDEKGGALKAYNLESVKDVIGYIVYPRTENDSPIEEKNFPKYEPFGLMEYIKPWGNNFDRVRKSGKDMEINLTCRKPGKTIEVRH